MEQPERSEIPAQFPAMVDNKGNVTLSIKVDKSVSKVAAWVIGYVVASSILVGIAIASFIWMIFEWRNAQMETRVLNQEIIYTQAAVAAKGIPIPHPARSDHPEKKEK